MGLEPGWGYAVNSFYAGEPGEARRIMDLARQAEVAGFDSVWLGDHILWRPPMLDAMALLAAFSATTQRVKLGMAVMLLGLRSPPIAAKFITSVNVMSEGRLVLGVGTGGENKDEFEFAGVPHNRRGRLLDDALAVLLDQWNESSHKLRVAPVGPPLPLLIGGRSDVSRRRIQRLGAGWLGAFVSPRRIRDEVALLNADAEHPVPIALNIYLRTGDDHDRTCREAAEFLGDVYSMDCEPLMRYSVAGSVAACAEQLAAYAEAGVQHFVLRPATWDQEGQIEQWSKELLPKLAGVLRA